MAKDPIPWIDLSPYGIHLHALRLPSGRATLVAAGNTAAYGAALAALGFRRTRQGHVVHLEPALTLREVRVHFPKATVQEMARDAVIRIVPGAPPATPPTLATVNTDHWIHNTTLLGVNRRGQRVYQDGAENRYLDGPSVGDST